MTCQCVIEAVHLGLSHQDLSPEDLSVCICVLLAAQATYCAIKDDAQFVSRGVADSILENPSDKLYCPGHIGLFNALQSGLTSMA